MAIPAGDFSTIGGLSGVVPSPIAQYGFMYLASSLEANIGDVVLTGVSGGDELRVQPIAPLAASTIFLLNLSYSV